MFSDGEIHDAAPEYLSDEKIASYPYPVYAISFVEPRYDSNFTISRLIDGTGGEDFRLKRGDQDSIAGTMQEIIARIVGARVPVRAALTNASLDPPRTSVSANMGFDRNPDGSGWTITLDSVLALAEGTNEITLALTYYDGATGRRETTAASFTIEVGDAAPDEQYLTCYDRPVLTATTSSGDALLDPAADSSFTVTMRAAAFDLIGKLNPAIATSHTLGDRLVMRLDTALAKDSSDYPYESFTATFAYEGAATAVTADDRTLQSAADDIIVFRWEHPRDPRDTAVLVVGTTETRRLIPPSATPAPGTYGGDNLEVSLVDPGNIASASIYYSLNTAAFREYETPVTLDAASEGRSHTIRAYVGAEGCLNSDTVSFAYTVSTTGTAVLETSPSLQWPPVAWNTYEAAGDPAPADEPAATETDAAATVTLRVSTPCSPGDRIPPAVLARLAPGPVAPPERGAMLRVSSTVPLRATRSRADIYDAVGNLVAERLALYLERGDSSRGWVLWNGRNRSGRAVGAGTYLAVLSLELADGTRRREWARIGVK
jgi:hypothetical protein